MKRSILTMFAAMFVLVFSCGDIWAQATAQIAGTVRDQSGAVLPGVEVTVTQIQTGVARSAVTNETGSYVLSNLPIGPYRLEAGLPGFRTFVQTGIVLQVNGSPVINPVLEVGQVSEQARGDRSHHPCRRRGAVPNGASHQRQRLSRDLPCRRVGFFR